MKRFLEKLVGKEESEVGIEDFLNNLHTKSEDVYANADAFVMPLDVTEDNDAKRAVDEVKKGNVLLLNISSMQTRNPVRLKSIMARIKDGVEEMDGDIARLTDDLVIVTPARVKIMKRRA